MQPGVICPVLDYLHDKLVGGRVPPDKYEYAAWDLLLRQSFYTTVKGKIRSVFDFRDAKVKSFLLWLVGRDDEDVYIDDIEDDHKEAAALLYGFGYDAVSEDKKVTFVSPLHRMIFLVDHFTLPSRNKPTLQEFHKKFHFGDYVKRVVGLMDTNVLANSSGRTAAGTRNERVCMDEFYRVGSSLLPQNEIWSPEVGVGFKVPGRVDYFCSGLGWFIEGMRDGKNRNEHLQRFREGGTYWQFLKQGLVKEWGVLDFAPQSVDFQEPAEGFWQIRFGEGFRTARILSPAGETLHVLLNGGYTMKM